MGSLEARKIVAFSGGCDSSVLLHLVARHCARETIHAVHINHQLSPNSGAWAAACAQRARELGVRFTAVSVTVRLKAGESVEAAARAARYDGLRDFIEDGDVLLTAHHRDDQALTVFLQMLRGAGSRGLAAMPSRQVFGKGEMLRPLLDATRAEIEAYAKAQKITWIDDDSNASLRYDRNYLRAKLAPILDERWPQWRKTIARVAAHQAESAQLLDEQAAIDMTACRVLNESPPVLSLRALKQFTAARRKQVIRHWLREAGSRMPSSAALDRIDSMIDRECGDGALESWRDENGRCAVRCYRRRLYIVRTRDAAAESDAPPPSRPWPLGSDLDLPEINRRLLWRNLIEQAPQLGAERALSVRFRQGGERCAKRFADGAKGVFHQDLKKVFQQHGCPPWRRARVPLIYADDELRLVWGITACARDNETAGLNDG